MATIIIPTIMQEWTENAKALKCEEPTVEAAFQQVINKFPHVQPKLFADDGTVHKHIAVFKNDQNINSLQGLQTPIDPSDEINIIVAMAGG